MALQIRLRHALGERTLEIPVRRIERPLIIGRRGDADLQIPSSFVAPHHAQIYVHKGIWVVDGSPGAATFVNGRRVDSPARLRAGDVITLGTEPNPPTIVFDPDGVAEGRGADAGRGASAPTEVSDEPAVRPAPSTPAATPPWEVTAPRVPVPTSARSRVESTSVTDAPPPLPPPRTASPTFAAALDDSTVDDRVVDVVSDDVDWATPAVQEPYVESAPSPTRVPSQRSTLTAMLIGFLLVGGVITGAWWYLNRGRDESPAPTASRPPATEPVAAPSPLPDPTQRSNPTSEPPEPGPTTMASPHPTNGQPKLPAPAEPPTTAPTTPVPPRGGELTWKAVEAAYLGTDRA